MIFKRKDLHKKKRLSDVWRKPKGLQNKRRQQKKGHAKIVKTGYIKKKKVMEIINVANKSQLKELDPKKHLLNILKISRKNKIEIIDEAEKAGFTLVNLDTKSYKKKFEELLNVRKEAAKLRQDKEKKKKEEEKKKPVEEKKEEKEELTEEEKKKKEKEEKDKILTKGQK